MFVLVLAAIAAVGQVKPVAVESVLTVVNEAGKQTQFKVADLALLKRVTVKASDHGTATTFDGVMLVDVLSAAGVVFGEKLRGPRLASYLLVEAADKYRVVYALAELDPGFTDRIVILADKRDGKPLDDKAAPWQIVAPDEKRPGRWVRQVKGLRVINAP
jgi:hypothetical protein